MWAMGVPQPVSELGETSVGKLKPAPSQNRVRIEFAGLDFRPGGTLRYQYQIEGADRDWGAPGNRYPPFLDGPGTRVGSQDSCIKSGTLLLSKLRVHEHPRIGIQFHRRRLRGRRNLKLLLLPGHLD